MGIRICPDCGGKVSDSRKDCIHCGYVFPVTKQCPDCGESVEENAKVCPECGYAFEVEQTTEVATASVAPTVQTNESKVEQTPQMDETTPIVCPQCGSTDISLQSSELGKCKHCGTTVVLPKKEQQVNIVNNFVVSNNAENSANYYTIKPERTLRDEFIREAYISLAKQRITPVDISDSKFDVVKDSVEQYIKVDSTANITYSATIGYDRQVEYTDYDSTGRAVKKTKTVTDWKPFSGSLVKEYVVFVGNDDKSMLDDDFKYALKSAKSSSVVPYDGTSKVNVAPLPPSPNAVESAKRLSIENAEFSAKKNLPGNHYKDFYATGSATVNSVNSYTAPRQSAKYTYGARHHECSSFAFGKFRMNGTCPDDSKSIHTLVEKKTNPLLWTSLALAILTLIMSIVACTCNLGSGVVGGIVAIVVPMIAMAVMFVVSLIVISKKYKKLISQAQHEKVERTNAKLRSLKLKPMTQEERAEATAKSSQSMLTKKRNPLRTATIILCVIMLIAGTICTFIVTADNNPDNYHGNGGYGGGYSNNGGNSHYIHIYTNNCDTSCNVCGATRTVIHTYTNNCDASCNVCGVTRTITHTYTNNCDGSCNVCSATRTAPHTYETTLTQGTSTHYYACEDCSSKNDEENHVYANTCDISCNECGATRTITHTYTNNCDGSCNVCSATRTAPHAYETTLTQGTSTHYYACEDCSAKKDEENHVYANTCDISCNECGATRTVGNHVDDNNDIICDICGGVADINLTFALNRDGESYTITGANTNLSGNITLPSAYQGKPVTTIGYNAFNNCSSMTSIVIPDSVTTIGSYAFRYCNSLTSVTIGDSVTTIGSFAFDHCDSLTDVYYTGDIAGWCGISFANGLANPMWYADNLYIDGKLVEGELVISDSVTTIPLYAFKGCAITSVVIPDSVTTIGDYAFYNCTSLTSIVIPDSVTTIGDYAFYNCTSLTSIVIPDSVTTINPYAFYKCTSLTSVTFEDPNGWYRTQIQNATSGTNLTLTNTSTNAKYLKSTYYNSYWYKK